jgi:uncharacterized membrane protein
MPERDRDKEEFDPLDADEWSTAADRRSRARAQRRRDRHARRAGAGRLRDTGSGRLLVGAVAVLALGTAVALVALWPSYHHRGPSEALGGPTLAATVVATRDVRCPGPTAQRCRRLVVRLSEGKDRGRETAMDLGPSNLVSSYSPGTDVRVHASLPPPGSHGVAPYQFAGVDRRGTLRWLLIAFALLVIMLTRWRGALALLGFGASLLLVLKFVVPAILVGSAPLLVAVVGALAVMFITVGLTYGVSVQSAAAVLGMTGSLLFAGLVGTIAVHAAHLDGRSGELAIALQQTNGQLSLQGIVLAGLVLGAIGVLADMAVTQASAVTALRRANPAMAGRTLYREAFGVGRDHLMATTQTLVLVYVGATLPLLLVLQSVGVSSTDALNVQDVADPIVATLVGAMALLVSVPLTTALATVLIARIPADVLPLGDASGHHH